MEARFLNVACVVVVILKLFKFNTLFYRIPFLNLEYVVMMFLVFVPFLFTLLHMRHFHYSHSYNTALHHSTPW